MTEFSSPLFVLASGSPTRKQLLENAGIHPVVCVSNFDESLVTLTDPAELVQVLARSKAESVVSQFAGKHALIMGCDSVLSVDGEIYGKPENRAKAIAMWQKMRGYKGELYTGHSLIDVQRQRTFVRYALTTVYFADATDLEISSYVDTGEPLACAGCFALERLGGLLVERLEGCHTNVLGLSLPLLRQMLRSLGYSLQFEAQETVIR
ncbi:nucleoside triphosphate pyrophosphatase [Tumidithrix helvetica PCC 7403]|uniref:nucleoside triphosphate pyrophosphatase n=1 Tax=Tumidithrix helvetica TaxID=3457545 RepID=UPI003C987B94